MEVKKQNLATRGAPAAAPPAAPPAAGSAASPLPDPLPDRATFVAFWSGFKELDSPSNLFNRSVSGWNNLRAYLYSTL